MQFKIVHQLTLMLVAAVVSAVIAVGAMVIWNLNGGFADYIRERDNQQLQRFASLVSEQAKEDPSLERLQGSFNAMRHLMDEFYRREGLTLRVGPAPAPATDSFRTDPGVTAPIDEPSGFAQRVQILNRNGSVIAGKVSRNTGPTAAISHPVMLEGQHLATVRLALAAVPAVVDAQFLRRQYLGLLAAMIITLAAAFVCARLMAGRWARPLLALQAATRQMARGRFDMPELPVGGAMEFSRLADDVRAMAKALQRLENDRRQWIAQLSHELRTPLTVLKGEIESIEDGARTPDSAIFQSLGHEVSQIARLVDDLHLLAVADLGALPLKRAPVKVSQVLNEMIERAIRTLKPSGVEMVFERVPVPAAWERPGEQMAFWDCGRIEQVLRNLVSNSARYTSAPGRSRIAWKLGERHQTAEIVVEDSGPGVSPDKLSLIFEPLFRGDESRTRATSTEGEMGSGLGLAIVKAIVIAHGGQVSAAASPWGGLAVTLRLPLNAGGPEGARGDC